MCLFNRIVQINFLKNELHALEKEVAAELKATYYPCKWEANEYSGTVWIPKNKDPEEIEWWLLSRQDFDERKKCFTKWQELVELCEDCDSVVITGQRFTGRHKLPRKFWILR